MSKTHCLSLDLTWARGTLAIHEVFPSGDLNLRLESCVGETFDHSERLIEVMDRSLGEVSISLADIGYFVTSYGPGSFTGLRIALISLKAFAEVTGNPIETMSGAEARAIAWHSRFPSTSFQEIHVVSQCTQTRAHRARFARSGERDLTLIAEEEVEPARIEKTHSRTIVLADSSLDSSGQLSCERVCFPLTASYLAESLPRAKSRKTHSSFEELVNLTPQYFGTARSPQLSSTPTRPDHHAGN